MSSLSENAFTSISWTATVRYCLDSDSPLYKWVALLLFILWTDLAPSNLYCFSLTCSGPIHITHSAERGPEHACPLNLYFLCLCFTFQKGASICILFTSGAVGFKKQNKSFLWHSNHFNTCFLLQLPGLMILSAENVQMELFLPFICLLKIPPHVALYLSHAFLSNSSLSLRFIVVFLNALRYETSVFFILSLGSPRFLTLVGIDTIFFLFYMYQCFGLHVCMCVGHIYTVPAGTLIRH